MIESISVIIFYMLCSNFLISPKILSVNSLTFVSISSLNLFESFFTYLTSSEHNSTNFYPARTDVFCSSDWTSFMNCSSNSDKFIFLSLSPKCFVSCYSTLLTSSIILSKYSISLSLNSPGSCNLAFIFVMMLLILLND